MNQLVSEGGGRKRQAEADRALNPTRVPIKQGLELLGRMSRSRFYVLAAQGVFDVFKDGTKTLISVESIDRYNASLPRARIGKQVSA